VLFFCKEILNGESFVSWLQLKLIEEQSTAVANTAA